MIQPLFTYPVKGTPWYIVVAREAKHFYFDSDSGRSVWQLSDTNIDELAGKVNFDELAILFAKSNGLRVGPKEEHKKRKRVAEISERSKRRAIEEKGLDSSENTPNAQSGQSHDEVQPKDLSEALETSNNEICSISKASGFGAIGPSIEIVEEGEEEQVQDASHNSGASEDTKSTGLDLGYSSSDDEFDESDAEAQKDRVHQTNSSEDEDVNDGLDLGFDLEDEDEAEKVSGTAQTEFKQLLDAHENSISLYDPWFLVEEELLPQLSQYASYYGIPDPAERELIFNDWVSTKTSSIERKHDQKSEKYPTSKLLYFRFLQEHKPEVRKLFFPEFYKKHAAQINEIFADPSNSSPEHLYREMRVTLNDYAAHEKAEKKRNVEGNLKVAHVENFLRRKLSGFKFNLDNDSAPDADSEIGDFDRWMQICNQNCLPEQIVGDATNFVLGDEKRLAAYLRVMGSI